MGTLFSASILVVSCGYTTPPVDTGEDILKLEPTTKWIRGRGLSDEAILSLSRIKDAEFLDLCGGYATGPLKITDNGFKNLVSISSELPNLYRLEICNCNHLSDQAISYIAEMPHLKSLTITGCSPLTDEAIEYLSHSKSIETIFLSRCPGITNKGFKYLSQSTSIKAVRLENFGPTQLNNIGLEYLAAMPNLQHIAFFNTPFLDTDSMRLLASFTNLKILALSCDKSISLNEDGLNRLADSRTIEELAFCMNDKISFNDVLSLSSLVTLKKLKIGKVGNIDRELLDKFHHVLPLCEVLCVDEKGVHIYKYVPSKDSTRR